METSRHHRHPFPLALCCLLFLCLAMSACGPHYRHAGPPARHKIFSPRPKNRHVFPAKRIPHAGPVMTPGVRVHFHR